MEVTIKTAFNPGDRVWMPDGHGGKMKGRVRGITLLFADLTLPPQKINFQSLNYRCVDINGGTFYFHEYQLTERNL